MTTIRRIGVLSAAKLYGALLAVFGLILGAFFSLFAVAGAGLAAMAGEDGDGSGVVALLFGVGAIIVLPIFYGVLGFVFGALQAWIYNFVARFVGGIEVELG